ncbi:sugar kinase, putative [Babesia ovata]|uniref:Sugar kinase, putative n=1 Tax=Babesia ovata TaxID=189622 RepID=A0A2H6K960_9APIC|nr:sugar kinase, putative [Babesia ovata]GBE59542.1 sugar kinase, putative [Babesia ovata]
MSRWGGKLTGTPLAVPLKPDVSSGVVEGSGVGAFAGFVSGTFAVNTVLTGSATSPAILCHVEDAAVQSFALRAAFPKHKGCVCFHSFEKLVRCHIHDLLVSHGVEGGQLVSLGLRVLATAEDRNQNDCEN